MLDVFLILMGILCLITGLAGCFLPVIPGPPVAYAGLLLLHFMPWGIVLGPFLGAFIGELFGGRETRQALKSGLGSLFGFLFGTVLKCVLCGYFAWEFASALL